MGAEPPSLAGRGSAVKGVTVRLPAYLEAIPGHHRSTSTHYLEPAPRDLAALLERLERCRPGVRERLQDPEHGLAVALNGELQPAVKDDLELKAGDEVEFLYAMSGG